MIVCIKCASLKFQFAVTGTAVRQPSPLGCAIVIVAHLLKYSLPFMETTCSISYSQEPGPFEFNPLSYIVFLLSYPAFDNIVIFCKTSCSELSLPLRFFDQNFACNSYFHLACLLSILNTVLIFCCRLGMCRMIEAFYAINLPSAGTAIRNILNSRRIRIYYVELSTVGTCDM